MRQIRFRLVASAKALGALLDVLLTAGLAPSLERGVFDDNIIPTNRISPITAKPLSLIPLANLPGTTADLYNSAPMISDRNNYHMKANWNRT